MQSGERQVAPDITGIRADHVARYEWADGLLDRGASVLDIGCGIGYGADLLARGRKVTALEIDAEALEYARKHYRRPKYKAADLSKPYAFDRLERFDAATAFEIIEHLQAPLEMLTNIPAETLLASVPNETYFPHGGNIKFHFRHYTEGEFRALLEAAGWRIVEMMHQEGPESAVDRKPGRTLVARCIRERQVDQDLTGKHVAIVAMGPSANAYLDYAKCMGGRDAVYDEVWGVNAMGDLLRADRVFHMDDVRVQEARAAKRPESNIARMVDWLKTHPGPIYTSHVEPGYKGLVQFPIGEIMRTQGQPYFNGTVAYAVAFAIHRGVGQLSIFGCDYSYEHSHHAEKGRACLEYWLARAQCAGVKWSLPRATSLLDSCESLQDRFYGFDGYEVRMGEDRSIELVPKAIPDADEIERRYDHSRPTSPHIRAQEDEQ